MSGRTVDAARRLLEAQGDLATTRDQFAAGWTRPIDDEAVDRYRYDEFGLPTSPPDEDTTPIWAAGTVGLCALIAVGLAVAVFALVREAGGTFGEQVRALAVTGLATMTVLLVAAWLAGEVRRTPG